jgi:hypothetical protein
MVERLKRQFELTNQRAQLETTACSLSPLGRVRAGARGFEFEFTRLLTPTLSSTARRRGRKIATGFSCIPIQPFNKFNFELRTLNPRL